MRFIYIVLEWRWIESYRFFFYERLPNIVNREIFSLACYYRGFVHTLKKWLLFLVKKCCVNTLERNFYWHFSSRCVVECTIPYCWILWIPFWYYKRASILYPCASHIFTPGRFSKYNMKVLSIQSEMKFNFYKKIQITLSIDKYYGIVTALNCHA